MQSAKPGIVSFPRLLICYSAVFFLLHRALWFMMPCSAFRTRIRPWLRDYDKIQSFAVFLIHIQIGCALVGSLGALYNGVLLINLAIALFALVAIESSSQSLARTYAVLLGCAIFLDISWFILFSHQIWNISPKNYGAFFVFSLRLALFMQIVGFCVRVASSLLWIRMYKLGASYEDNALSREADSDLRNSFLNPPAHIMVRQNSDCDVFLGGSIYDPAYYSSLFEDAQENGSLDHKHGISDNGGNSCATEASQLKSCISRSFQLIDDESAINKSPNF
ncbi:PREDICTED: uncharacterized protein LOC104597710 [Nelumbo nucifera]|uniref:Uncharacterized protein LOC104597710 n=1 Tax=Nelumbo nucifera TaxID=4432 RepID=A0A1U7ZTR3_NELNU|nr:PREDICTED: uncharacterized protein LOC104597710 [Nelumbo nucifera]XP_010257726.1 PREDICTED: uncharacterized protein LOC104597710 [Nelumbo nucifera]XP_010257727.1 PREDICTED: uncharacterized protein LOC104597710 [Nelumbo nucifera]XP_019053330.1 PREDICTED: uncharacterized protein LOC104597710 [Nelumbo nucifera]